MISVFIFAPANLPSHLASSNSIMGSPGDELKWFGEGFEGFPKRLPDDCVEYMLMIINTSLSQREQLTLLEQVRKETLRLKKKFLQEYIWQREELDLKSEIQNADGRSLSPKQVSQLTNQA